MKARRPWIFVSLAGLAVVGLAIFLLRPPEPVYQGRPLSFWVDRLPCNMAVTNGGTVDILTLHIKPRKGPVSEPPGVMYKQAREAIATIGTNALPYLSKHLFARDSRLDIWVQSLLRKQRLIPLSPPAPAIVRRGQALTAILELGDKSKPLVPELLRMSDHSDSAIRATVRCALERVAPETVPGVKGSRLE